MTRQLLFITVRIAMYFITPAHAEARVDMNEAMPLAPRRGDTFSADK